MFGCPYIGANNCHVRGEPSTGSTRSNNGVQSISCFAALHMKRLTPGVRQTKGETHEEDGTLSEMQQHGCRGECAGSGARPRRSPERPGGRDVQESRRIAPPRKEHVYYLCMHLQILRIHGALLVKEVEEAEQIIRARRATRGGSLAAQ
jgi:hypothetical protein